PRPRALIERNISFSEEAQEEESMKYSGLTDAQNNAVGHLLTFVLTSVFTLAFAHWSSLTASAKTPATRHPLDPLTKEEVAGAVAALKKAGKLAPDARFVTIYLKEPPKDQVIADVAAGRARRSAFALLYNWATRVTSEAVVGLGQYELISWKDL